MKLSESIHLHKQWLISCVYEDIDGSCTRWYEIETFRQEDAISHFRAKGWHFSKKKGGWVCPICWKKDHPIPVWMVFDEAHRHQ